MVPGVIIPCLAHSKIQRELFIMSNLCYVLIYGTELAGRLAGPVIMLCISDICSIITTSPLWEKASPATSPFLMYINI